LVLKKEKHQTQGCKIVLTCHARVIHRVLKRSSFEGINFKEARRATAGLH